jgi:alkyl sulfatase BDS1-like metallo-beta-lactamase superfamily hydrolase
MSALGADLMLGGHGVPVTNADRIRQTLENTATYLETLIAQTLACINEGATLSETIHRVSAPESLTSLPYLRPLYDEPEFVVRNIWRQFAGWYDGNPAHLKPAPDDQLARELAQLCGGPSVLTARALQLSQDGSHRLASHLAQLAVGAAPEDVEAHEARAQIFARRAEIETSMMAKGIYAWAEAESRAALSGRAPAAEPSGSVLTHEATRGGGSRPPGARGHRR